MNKKTKILIIGFGSIGQRHYHNLLGLGFKEIYVYDIDKNKIKKTGIKTVPDLGLKVLKNFAVAFICNPSNFHIKTALRCAKAGCHLFIEKPLSHNLRGIKELLAVCQKNKLINMVACNMRFQSCLEFIKKYVDNGKLGIIYSIALETGYYLPYWRPGQDYRKGYAARKATGGGIILDGGIHNFDLLFWLNSFADVSRFNMLYNKAGDLEIETEDNFVSIVKFNNQVLGMVKGDYLQQFYSWTCKVVGSKGNLEWNFFDNVVYLKNHNRIRKLFEMKKNDVNGMYIKEIRYFLNCVNKNKRTFNNIQIATQVLECCLNK